MVLLSRLITVKDNIHTELIRKVSKAFSLPVFWPFQNKPNISICIEEKKNTSYLMVFLKCSFSSILRGSERSWPQPSPVLLKIGLHCTENVLCGVYDRNNSSEFFRENLWLLHLHLKVESKCFPGHSICCLEMHLKIAIPVRLDYAPWQVTVLD